MIFHTTCLGFDVEVGGGCLTVSFESIHPSDDKGCPLARSRPPGTSGGELGDLVFFPHRCKIWFPSSRTSCSSGRKHLSPVLVTRFQPRYKHLRTLVFVISQEFSRPAVSNQKPAEVFLRPPSCEQSKTRGSFYATAPTQMLSSSLVLQKTLPNFFPPVFCCKRPYTNFFLQFFCCPRPYTKFFLQFFSTKGPTQFVPPVRGSFSATAQL